MATVLTHALVGVALARAGTGERWLGPVARAAMIVSMAPDADVVGFRLGVEYGDLLGHRGLSHSLPFAALLAAAALPFLRRTGVPAWKLFLLLFASAASHGLLDAMTNGGLGIAFFSPFDATRYFLPWQPIWVSPIAIEPFLTWRGMAVLETEALYVWLPLAAILVPLELLRRRRRQRPA